MNQSQNQTQNQYTRINNIEHFELDYTIYKALIRPISDLISILYDVAKNVHEYVDTDERLQTSLDGYSSDTLRTRSTLLYDILGDCVRSYNIYKQNPNQFNSQSWGGEYPQLDIKNINNSSLINDIGGVIIFFSLYYHPDENENRQRYTYIHDFQEAVYQFCNKLIHSPEEIGLSQELLSTVPDKLSNNTILDIVTYSMSQNNNQNNNINNRNNNQNYNNYMNQNNNQNGLPNNNSHSIVKNYNTALNTSSVKKCFDPLLANEKNIINEDAVLYILNKQNKIIRTICIDEDSFNGILINKSNLFYQCKPTVPQGSLYIPPSAVLPTRLRKIAIDIIAYVYENQAKQIQLGRKYILTPTDTPVGRIASYGTIRGNSVVSAEHCQNNYPNDFIYDIQEYSESTTGGKRRKTKKLKKTQKAKKIKKATKVNSKLKKTKRRD